MNSSSVVPTISDVPTVYPAVTDVGPVPEIIDLPIDRPNDDILDVDDLDVNDTDEDDLDEDFSEEV